MRKLSQIISNLAIIVIAVFFISCSKEPVPFDMGKDVCEHCKMTIVDPKWGAQLITSTGKNYKYDVIECMILHEKTLEAKKVHSKWTINYLNNEQFIKVEDAIYVRSLEFNSPMGLNAISLSKDEEISQLKLQNTPEKLKWNQLLNIVESEFSEE